MKTVHILFITSNYPTPDEPNRGTFVRQLVRKISEKGIKCSVICPVSTKRSSSNLPANLTDNYIKENPINILYPRFFSISNKSIMKFNTFRITIRNFNKSVLNALSLLDSIPTIVYGHFLYPSGYSSAIVGQKLGIPSFVAVGESGTTIINNVEKNIGLKKTIKHFNYIDGVISVSKQNSAYCSETLKINKDKIKELPNGIDNTLFVPHDKKEMRLKHGLPLNKTIIAFTGQFIERKGPDRLLKAIKDIEGITVIFIGKGPIQLKDKQIKFKGVLEHEKVPEYLSASDMFVLPTLAEGSCNAIIEAMGCGIPIISSKGEFNDNILNDTVAIRVDPMNIKEIRDAIVLLNDNKEKRKKMGEAAFEHSKGFGITKRADKILEWIQEIEKRYIESNL